MLKIFKSGNQHFFLYITAYSTTQVLNNSTTSMRMLITYPGVLWIVEHIEIKARDILDYCVGRLI